MNYFKNYLRIILKTLQKCVFLLERKLGFKMFVVNVDYKIWEFTG